MEDNSKQWRLHVLRCSALEEHDTFSANDPTVSVFMVNNETENSEAEKPLLRTEPLEEKKNPSWLDAVAVLPELKQSADDSEIPTATVLIAVYDHDPASGDDLIGQATLAVPNDGVAVPEGTASEELVLKLRRPNDEESDNARGYVVVKWQAPVVEEEQKEQQPAENSEQQQPAEEEKKPTAEPSEQNSEHQHEDPQEDSRAASPIVVEQPIANNDVAVECDGTEWITVTEGQGRRVERYSLLTNSMADVYPEHRHLVAAMRQTYSHVRYVEEKDENQEAPDPEPSEECEELRKRCLLLLHALDRSVIATSTKRGTAPAESLRGMELALSLALKNHPLAPRPALMQVLHSDSNAEVDLARQAQDGSGRMHVQRVAMTLPYVTATIEEKQLALKIAREDYEASLDAAREEEAAIKAASTDPFAEPAEENKEPEIKSPSKAAIRMHALMQTSQSAKMVTASGALHSTSNNNSNAESPAASPIRQNASTSVVSAVSPPGTAPAPVSQQTAALEDTSRSARPVRQRRHKTITETQAKMLTALEALRTAEADVAQWRENKALVQFAIEVFHHAEASTTPITNDSSRPQLKRLLQTVRLNLSRLEEALKENINATDKVRNAEEKQALGVQRIDLYRESELLRGSEAVLEACVQEKKQLMQVLRSDRVSFNATIKEQRDMNRAKDREVVDALARVAILRKENEVLTHKCDELYGLLKKGNEHVAQLHKHLDAVREKRKQGIYGQTELPSPYDIQADPHKPTKVVTEQEQIMLDRLYARPLQKILHPVDKPSKIQVEPKRMPEATIVDHMYYNRRDMHEKRQKKLVNKYKATIAETHAKPSIKLTSKAALDENVDRMYRQRREKKLAQEEKLFKEHVESRDPKMVKVTSDDQSGIVNRLYSHVKGQQK